MTNKEYLEEMNMLVVKLTDACNNFGFQSGAYNAVLRDIAVCASRFNRSRLPRPWIVLTILWVLLAILAWLCCEFLCLPKT